MQRAGDTVVKTINHPIPSPSADPVAVGIFRGITFWFGGLSEIGEDISNI